MQWGAQRAPLELIAYVAETDRPYTDVLTAPYIMANPQAARAYGVQGDFGGVEDPHEFRPTQIASYYRECEGMDVDWEGEFGLRVLQPGPCSTDFPHAGLLNTKVFLQRYPTTATNRNRARSRWTYYHFLGYDIEASAARTADPDALADRDNPTLHNPACTVCHTVLDPVAGAFQDYGNEGHYRNRWGGLDALDWTYVNDWPVRVAVAADSWSERETLIVDVGTLEAGRREIQMASLWLSEGNDRFWTPMVLDRVVLRDTQGSLVDTVELDPTDPSCGASRTEEGARIWGSCIVAVDVPERGTYTLHLTAHRWGQWFVCPPDGSDCYWRDQGPAAAQLGLRVAHFYREGDTWYRGMRAPGFAGEEPRRSQDSMTWLAEEIIADPRFAESVVKFWWPAIMGSDVEQPPQAQGDATFSAQLLRSNAQNLEVARLAGGFRRGFDGGRPHNLKDLLVEITLSKWFRALSLDGGGRLQRSALEGAGARRLLTPEELARKTDALTGFQWGRWHEYDANPGRETRNALTGDYRLLYGGIDSDGVTERSTDLTSVMFAVAESHGVESSCPIVLREFFLLDDGHRRLFNGIDVDVNPTTRSGETAIREKLVGLYYEMMGVELGPKSRDVNTAFALFLRVWQGKADSRSDWLFTGRSCDYGSDLTFFDGILKGAVVLQESKVTYGDGSEYPYFHYAFDWDRIHEFIGQVNPRDNGGASAWIVVLAYLMTDYRYLYL